MFNIVDKREQIVWEVKPKIGDVFSIKGIYTADREELFMRIDFNISMDVDTAYTNDPYILVVCLSSNKIGHIPLTELKNVKILDHELVLK